MQFVFLSLELMRFGIIFLKLLSKIPHELRKQKLKNLSDVFEDLNVAVTREDKIKSAKRISDIIVQL